MSKKPPTPQLDPDFDYTLKRFSIDWIDAGIEDDPDGPYCNADNAQAIIDKLMADLARAQQETTALRTAIHEALGAPHAITEPGPADPFETNATLDSAYRHGWNAAGRQLAQ